MILRQELGAAGYALAFPVPGTKTQVTTGDDLGASVLRGTNLITAYRGRGDLALRIADVPAALPTK